MILRKKYIFKKQIPSFSHVFIKGNLNRSDVSKCQKLWGNKNIWQITLKILTEKFFTCEKESFTFIKSKGIKNLKLVIFVSFSTFDTKFFTESTVRTVRFSFTAVSEVGRYITGGNRRRRDWIFVYLLRLSKLNIKYWKQIHCPDLRNIWISIANTYLLESYNNVSY